MPYYGLEQKYDGEGLDESRRLPMVLPDGINVPTDGFGGFLCLH